MPDQPTVRMKQFIIELGKCIKKAEVDDHEFRLVLRNALLHIEAMPIGTTDRFIKKIAAACGVAPSTVRRWADGKVSPLPRMRAFVLRAAHEYLSARYA